MDKTTLHPNEQGLRFVAGKMYVWIKTDNNLRLVKADEDVIKALTEVCQ